MGRRHRSITIAAVLLLAGLDIHPAALAQETPGEPVQESGDGPVAEMIASGELQRSFNPEVLAYLLEEGASRLPENQRTAAIDEMVVPLKERIDIEPSAQIAASLTTLAGLVAGGDVGATLGETGDDVWSSWVDAGFMLMRAGYVEDAVAFFEGCARQFPREQHRARCVIGLAEAQPEQAFDLLAAMTEDDSLGVEGQNVAIRLLGRMAGSESCPPEQKAAIIELLVEKSQGMMNSVHQLAATRGLIYTSDERAVNRLRDLTGGFTTPDEVKQLAKSGLLLQYGVEEMADEIADSLGGGFMSSSEPAEQFWAASTLVEAGDERGYEWVLDELKDDGGGGLFGGGDDDEDYFEDCIWLLVRTGGERAIEVLAEAIEDGDGDDFRKAFLAVALARLGDGSRLDLVRDALDEEDWVHLRWQAAISLAYHDDPSGIPVLATLATEEQDGVEHDTLQDRVAWAAGRIDHADVVPILVGLLSDDAADVRLAAAFGLMAMQDPAALTGLEAAMGTDYGATDAGSRNPTMQARIVRHALAEFGDAPGVAPILDRAAASDWPSVRFLSLVAGG